MNAPTGLTITSTYSLGDWEGFCQVKWTSPAQPISTEPFYRVEYHDIVSSAWIWLTDVPDGYGDIYGVSVKFASAPPGGTPITRDVDQVRITVMDALGVGVSASTSINTPTVSSLTHVVASNFAAVCRGKIGDEKGWVDLTWDDLTKFVSSGRITLTKYGLTSPGIQRTLFDSSFTGKPSDYGPNRTHIEFDLLPPGIQIPDSLLWDVYRPLSNDPAAPFWVVEGDVLTLRVITSADGDTEQKMAEFSFKYHREATIGQMISGFVQAHFRNLDTLEPLVHTCPAGVDQSGKIYLKVAEDPYFPIAPDPVITYISGIPSGMSYVDATRRINGTASVVGIFTVVFDVTSEGNYTTRQSVTLNVIFASDSDTVAADWPRIIAPPPVVVLQRGVEYPSELSVDGPGAGIFIVSGTLPVGLTLGSFGVITGTPTAVEAPHNVVFHQFGPLHAGPNYTVNYEVVAGATPVITSASTLGVFHDQCASYRIESDINSDEFRAFFLPEGLVLRKGVITGTPTALPGNYTIQLQAHNVFGWGTMFRLVITVDIPIPVISSPSSAAAILDEFFSYQIAATNEPDFYGADGLPDGLLCNPASGEITGVPQDVGSYSVKISAVNGSGSGSSTLALSVALSAVPVIDTSALNGRAITLQANETFTFQPSASNNPVSWSADPLPPGLSFDRITGRLSGQFIGNGFYSITFVATNRGGNSDPVTFYFLVGVAALAEGIPPSPIITLDNVDLWVDLDTGLVAVGGPFESMAEMTVKRGDSTIINVTFHKSGVPVDIDLTALYFGAKQAFDDDYIVHSTDFRRLDIGRYRTYPDFSDQNNELDSALSDEKITLIGEVQWDLTGDIRRSTQTFNVVVLRDLLHPDPAQ